MVIGDDVAVSVDHKASTAARTARGRHGDRDDWRAGKVVDIGDDLLTVGQLGINLGEIGRSLLVRRVDRRRAGQCDHRLRRGGRGGEVVPDGEARHQEESCNQQEREFT